ncbi:MAG: hypothetical protein AAF690_26770 [Acidobacteriota bacterium]
MSEAKRRRAVLVTIDAGKEAKAVLGRLRGTVEVPGAVIPLLHKRLTQNGAGWNASLLVFPDETERAREVGETLVQQRDESTCRVALLQLQPTIDMLYPKQRGQNWERGEVQLVEYVTSKVEERDDYYRCQQEVSGPAMREVWETGVLSRFLGFELQETLWRAESCPDWDVVHLAAGARRRAIPFVLSTRKALDQHSRAAGRGSLKHLRQRWDTQRTNVKAFFKQPPELTQVSEVLAAELPY